MDALDDRQGLRGQRQHMTAAVIRIRQARHEAVVFQAVEQANQRDGPDVKDLSEGGLIEAFMLREVDDDGTSRAVMPGSRARSSRSWRPRAKRAVSCSSLTIVFEPFALGSSWVCK